MVFIHLVTGDAYWTRINPIQNKYTYLSDDMECDVLIIGGGITGALCAYYFTKAGINTALVDKNIIGYGSTSASTSILQYEIDNNLIGLKGLIGIENAVLCFRLCEKIVYDIQDAVNELKDDCGFKLRECLYYSHKASDVDMLKKEFELRRNYGFDVDFIDGNIAESMFSFPLKGGILSKSGAGEIDPYRFTHKLLEYSHNKGLQIYENTEIAGIINSGSHVTAVTKNKFKVKARKMIFCAGFESVNYIKKNIVNFSRSFTVVTKPVDSFKGWHNRCIIRNNEDNYTYLRSTGEGRILIGGEDEGIGGIRSKMSRISQDSPASTNKYKILIDRLKSMFPDINGIEAEYTFSGLFGETKDSLPYIGEYKRMPNCYFCLGYGSNGILYAAMGAQMLRDLYLDSAPPELELFSFER